MLKKNKLFLPIALGAAVLLIGGGVAAYLLLVQRNLTQANAPAQLVPQDALLTASISTDSAQWQQLREYGTPETRAALDKQLTRMRDTLLTANGYNYEKDIKPWLGETVTLAYFPGTPTPETDGEQKPPEENLHLPDLIVLPIENPGQAQVVLEKTKFQKATQFAERTYKGVQIRETKRKDSRAISAAVLGSFLVVTKNPKLIDRAIDTYKGATSVVATPGYKEKLQKISAPKPFAQLYLNVPAFSAAAAANSRRELSPEEIADKQPRQGVGTTVTLEPEGIRFQGISWLKPDSTQKNEVENTSSRLPRRLPANTLVALSGGNLAQLWQGYVEGAQSNPLLPIAPANLSAGLKTTLDLDVEQDLVPWMEGEFLWALVPAAGNASARPSSPQDAELGAGVVMMVQASDRKRAEEALQRLDSVMAARYQFAVEPGKLGGQSVVNWTSPLGGVSATHGWLEGNVVFLTFGAPIANAIVPQPPATLTQSPLFQQAVPTKPNPNNGQFFVDVERTINDSQMNLPQLPPQQKMLAKAIRAVGVTVANNDERSNRFDLFVQLKKTLTPSPTPSVSIEGSSESPASPPTP